jgi:hypothetical protein
MRYYAFEGRIFVISSCSVWSEEMKDVLQLDKEARSTFIGEGGHSGILNPIGDYLVGPQDDLETILYADLDLEEVTRGKLTHDVTGHYQRFDVFSLQVNRQAYEKKPVGSSPQQPPIPLAEGEENPSQEGLLVEDRDRELVES